ncbi:MAG TPA: ABC transporter permease [Stellaceae bacterium]
MPPRLRRILGLMIKEGRQIVRDPSAMLIAGLLPLILLFLFGTGVSLDIRNVRIGLVIERPTAETASFAAALQDSRYFTPVIVPDARAVKEDLVAGSLEAVVVLAADFGNRTARDATAPIQVIVDGSDPNTANLVQAYIAGVWANWVRQEGVAHARIAAPPVTPVPRFWFNPAVDSRNFLVPGSIAIVMTLIGTLLTSLVVAREWERGTMEALLATPAGTIDFLIGKLVPYFLLGMISLALSVAVSVWGFGVPFRGSLPWLGAVSSVFLLASLGLGLFISTVTGNQFVASQVALIAGFLPAFLLSGFIFEIGSMPLPIRILTYILPARYLMPSLQTLFLAGDVTSVLLPNIGAMAIIASVLIGLTVWRTKRRLD